MRIETEPNRENPEQFQPYTQASATTTPSGLVHNILPYTLWWLCGQIRAWYPKSPSIHITSKAW